MAGEFFIGINGVSVVDLISRFAPGRKQKSFEVIAKSFRQPSAISNNEPSVLTPNYKSSTGLDIGWVEMRSSMI